MDPGGGNDGGYHSDNPEDVDDLTERFAKLWWEGTDKTISDQWHPNSFPTNDENSGDDIWVDKAKYLASISVQATMERLWAKELFEMNPREREDINNEIHGVQSSRAIQETPSIISEGVRSLRDLVIDHLEEISESILSVETREAYQQVVASGGGMGGSTFPYIHSHQFLIKFLRACFFDAGEACQRYFRCLDLMHGLFGDIALKRPLMMSDLTIREQRYLKKGQMQLLPARDRAGRRIYSFSGREDKSFTVPEKYRTSMYLIDVCSEDETTQKLGIVSLNSPKIDPGAKPFGEEGMALRPKKYEQLGGLSEQEFYKKFQKGKPLRTSAIHYTGPDSFLYKVGKSLILALVGKDDRKRIRFHAGSQMECNYSLKSFGIPSDELPVSEDGHFKNRKVARFIAARKSIESLRQQQYEEEAAGMTPNLSPTATECPGVNCILFGNRSRKNAANLEFRNILMVKEQRREEQIVLCESVPSARDFVNDIIQTAKSPPHNLRFVVLDKKTWLFVEIEDPQKLYTAVSQALRDQRKRMRLDKRLLQNSSVQQQRSNEKGMGISMDSESRDVGSIIGFDAAKRRKGSSIDGCCNP